MRFIFIQLFIVYSPSVLALEETFIKQYGESTSVLLSQIILDAEQIVQDLNNTQESNEQAPGELYRSALGKWHGITSRLENDMPIPAIINTISNCAFASNAKLVDLLKNNGDSLDEISLELRKLKEDRPADYKDQKSALKTKQAQLLSDREKIISGAEYKNTEAQMYALLAVNTLFKCAYSSLIMITNKRFTELTEEDLSLLGDDFVLEEIDGLRKTISKSIEDMKEINLRLVGPSKTLVLK